MNTKTKINHAVPGTCTAVVLLLLVGKKPPTATESNLDRDTSVNMSTYTYRTDDGPRKGRPVDDESTLTDSPVFRFQPWMSSGSRGRLRVGSLRVETGRGFASFRSRGHPPSARCTPASVASLVIPVKCSQRPRGSSSRQGFCRASVCSSCRVWIATPSTVPTIGASCREVVLVP